MRTLLFAAGVSLMVSLLGTKILIDVLTQRRIGQPIREDGPRGHATKAGTPTMGGAAIVAGAVVGYLASDISNSRIITRSGLVVMFAVVGAGLVGLADDWIKVTRERNLGLTSRTKFLGLVAVAVTFAVLAVNHTPVSTDLSFTRAGALVDLGTFGWSIWAVLLIVGATNAVNLTDGLDGLAGGAAALAFSAFIVIGFWAFRHPFNYGVPHALDLAVVAACMTGACVGFLWWNASPAQIFMGDTGSLAIGAGLAGLALMNNTSLLLAVIGALFVVETLSVMIQVASFRLFGRRIFRMAPIHHHFELRGWPETTVIIRFWILSGMCTAVGLGLYYADFIGLPGSPGLSPSGAVVVGLGVTGRAVTRALVARGASVTVVEDRPDDAHRAFADELGIGLVEAPTAGALQALLGDVEVLLPSPGVPDRHPVFAAAAAAGVPVRSEFDLAGAWDDRPIVAVTGTNGKTTVTHLAADMLRRAGRVVAEAGNVDTPLVEAIEDPAVEVFVVEASSFRLGHTAHWAPGVAAWLNFAPDHLDVHADLAAYEAAKARIWADQGPDDVAVVNTDDPVVAGHHGRARRRTFGFGGHEAATVRDGWLVVDDRRLLAVADLRRSLHHDQANALAAALMVEPLGVDDDVVATALTAFTGLPHRVQLVGEGRGVTWYDDSKATTPHATRAAVDAFASVVLIAGGRNKGLDLGEVLGRRGSVRAVVAIGEAATDVVDVVAGRVPVATAPSMAEAVAEAAALAHPGDVVVLSPGCASFDWYSSYGERGEDFTRLVRLHLDREASRP